jgi:hypothetical protein
MGKSRRWMSHSSCMLGLMSTSAACAVLDAWDGTEDQGGSTIPTVIATSPSWGVTQADPDSPIEATFAADMDPNSINEATFRVSREDILTDDFLTGRISYSPESREATFEPDRPLALLGHYRATVTLGVRSAAGLEPDDNETWSFAVRDGVWDYAEAVEGTALFITPAVALDEAGNAIAIWTESSPGAVWSNRYTEGTGWGSTERIDARTGDVYEPSVAVDAAGNAIAVWVQPRRGTSVASVWTNRYEVGSGWGEAHIIGTAEYGVRDPRIAMDATGDALVVWTDDGVVWVDRYSVASGWGEPEPVSPYPGTGWGLLFAPQVVFGPAGDAMIVWDEFDIVDKELTPIGAWSSRYEPGSGWRTAERMDANGEGHYPSVAFDPYGDAIAVYVRDDQVWSARQFFVGWQDPVEIEFPGPGTPEDLQIACDGAGNAVAIWTARTHRADGEQVKPDQNIWLARYDSFEEEWETARPMEPRDVWQVGSPRIVLDEMGHALAVWWAEGIDGSGVRSARMVVGSDWSPPIWMGRSYELSLAMNSTGRAVLLSNSWNPAAVTARFFR